MQKLKEYTEMDTTIFSNLKIVITNVAENKYFPGDSFTINKCWVPHDGIPFRSYPLFLAQDILEKLIASFQGAQE